MKLKKDNVVMIAWNEREIRRLKRDGFVEVSAEQTPVSAEQTPVSTENNQDHIDQGADSSAPFADMKVKDLKRLLDERGIEYKKNANKETLIALLTGGDHE